MRVEYSWYTVSHPALNYDTKYYAKSGNVPEPTAVVIHFVKGKPVALTGLDLNFTQNGNVYGISRLVYKKNGKVVAEYTFPKALLNLYWHVPLDYDEVEVKAYLTTTNPSEYDHAPNEIQAKVVQYYGIKSVKFIVWDKQYTFEYDEAVGDFKLNVTQLNASDAVTEAEKSGLFSYEKSTNLNVSVFYKGKVYFTGVKSYYKTYPSTNTTKSSSTIEPIEPIASPLPTPQSTELFYGTWSDQNEFPYKLEGSVQLTVFAGSVGKSGNQLSIQISENPLGTETVLQVNFDESQSVQNSIDVDSKQVVVHSNIFLYLKTKPSLFYRYCRNEECTSWGKTEVTKASTYKHAELYAKLLAKGDKPCLFYSYEIQFGYDENKVKKVSGQIEYTLNEALNDRLVTETSENGRTYLESEYFLLEASAKLSIVDNSYEFTFASDCASGNSKVPANFTALSESLDEKALLYQISDSAELSVYVILPGGKEQYKQLTESYTKRYNVKTDEYYFLDSAFTVAKTPNADNFEWKSYLPYLKRYVVYRTAGPVKLSENVYSSIHVSSGSVTLNDGTTVTVLGKDVSPEKMLEYDNSSSVSFEDSKGKHVVTVTAYKPSVYLSVDTSQGKITATFKYLKPFAKYSLVLHLEQTEDGEKEYEEKSENSSEDWFNEVSKEVLSKVDFVKGAKTVTAYLEVNGTRIPVLPDKNKTNDTYYEVVDNAFVSKYRLEARYEKGKVAWSVLAPILRGKVVVTNENGNRAEYNFTLKRSGEVSLCELGKGQKFNTVTVSFDFFGKLVSKSVDIPDPKFTVNEREVVIDDLAWACKLTVHFSGRSMPLAATLEPVSIDFEKEFTESGEIDFPDLPLGEVTWENAETGVKGKLVYTVTRKKDFPDPLFVHPLVTTTKVLAYKDGRFFDTDEATLNMPGYAIFEYKGKQYAYYVCTPAIDMSIAELAGIAKVMINVDACYFSPLSLILSFYKKDGIERKEVTVTGKKVISEEVSDTLCLQVTLRKGDKTLFSRMKIVQEKAYGELSIVNKTVKYRVAIAKKGEQVCYKVIGVTSRGYKTLLSECANEVIFDEGELNIPDDVIEVKLLAYYPYEDVSLLLDSKKTSLVTLIKSYAFQYSVPLAFLFSGLLLAYVVKRLRRR